MANIHRTASVFFIIAFLGVLHAQTPAATTLTVSGDLPMPLTLSADDLAKMPRETVKVPAGGTQIEYEGVLLSEILQRAGAPLGKALRGKALASYVLAKASDDYQVVFTLGELDSQFGAAHILVADRRDGKPLPADQAPFRLVCPGDKEGARSVRMLQSLQFVRLRK
jgi:DMSO/TMAO reductase YedYZ molybdopterin-dependent catalytic subunit